MVDTSLITCDSVARARQALLTQGRKASQHAVIKHLGSSNFSQVGPLLRELESKAEEVQTVAALAVPGSPYCPVTALRMWLQAAGISDGPLFRRISSRGAVGDAALNES